ncbi:MAG: accessory factor UbiK family protein [Motiliproteus sp.]|nr:accessory factor UbiK family protein [Motiliproteus sp.]MCW9051497.1 accessory factor UbiK family protein [Motiliproteus sp.]
MIAPKLIEGLNEQLLQLFGEGPQKTQDELKRGANQILQSAFSRLDLVTREEFDTQQEVLMRTRSLVDALEKRVAELEAKPSAESDSAE